MWEIWACCCCWENDQRAEFVQSQEPENWAKKSWAPEDSSQLECPFLYINISPSNTFQKAGNEGTGGLDRYGTKEFCDMTYKLGQIGPMSKHMLLVPQFGNCCPKTWKIRISPYLVLELPDIATFFCPFSTVSCSKTSQSAELSLEGSGPRATQPGTLLLWQPPSLLPYPQDGSASVFSEDHRKKVRHSQNVTEVFTSWNCWFAV